MATRVETIETMVCDLHETEHEAEAGTIEFSYKGTEYSIDLCLAGEDRLDRALAPFLQAAQVVKPSRTRRKTTAVKKSAVAPNGQTDNDAIRAWARKEGYEVADRGRIAGEVIAAYKESNRRSRAATAA